VPQVVSSCVGRSLSTCQTCRVRSKNSNYRYRGRVSTKAVLLERFIKFTPLDASLVCKAPFNLKCKGSFFDSENKVDTPRNYSVSQEREAMKREEKAARRRELRKSLEEDILGEEEDLSTQQEDQVSSHQIPMPEIPDNLKNVLDYVQNQAKNSETGKLLLTLEELEQLKSNYETKARSGSDREAEPPKVSLYPFHLKLLGRREHRVDSYSIQAQPAHSLNQMPTSTSHIYVSDAQTAEEALAMFGQSHENIKTESPVKEFESFNVPKGNFSLWSPVTSLAPPTEGPPPDSLNSRFSVYCPNHIMDAPDPGLKAVFLTPTMMNKIHLEAERQASIDLNCKLMDQLAYVGLHSEYGQIKVRDVWSHEMRLSTKFGDILCEGCLEGDIQAQTQEDGDFIGKVVLGPSLRVLTDAGDICLWDDLASDLAELFTVSGHVHCRRVYGNVKIVIREHGTAHVNVVEGSVDCVVRDGDIVAHLDTISQDSYLEVGSGNIHIHIPKNFPHRISLLASKNTISPHILNCGEFSLTPDGKESFVSGVDSFPGELEQPSLIVRCHSGEITLQGPRPDKQIDDALEIR